MDNEEQMVENTSTLQKVKRRKPGIIYLSAIPPNMNVTSLRAYFCKYGQIGRVYLQPQKEKKKRKKKSYSEGWIEFNSKRKAKHVQEFLNNQPVGGKKSNPDYDILWNIKYLPRFKWEYLTKRLEYEQQTYKMRMGAEISQVNKETDHYLKATMNKQSKKQNLREGISIEKFSQVFGQKLTEEEIQNKKIEEKQKKKLSKNEKDMKYKKLLEKKKNKKSKLKNIKRQNDVLATSIFVGGST